MSDPSQTRIYLRPIGSPLTIAMAGLAIASFVQSGLDLGWLSTIETHKVGLILISVPFVTQLLGSVFSYLARDGAGGATMGILATTWLAMGLIHLDSLPGSTSHALGLLLLAAGTLLAFSALALAAGKPLPGLVFLLAGGRFIVAGIYQLGAGSGAQHVAGIVGLVVTGLAGYSLLAFELEGERKPVLPTFRIGRAARALRAGVAEQVSDVEHEAGVRQTT